MTPDALAAILAAHAQWLATQGQAGVCAELKGSDLSGMDLQAADLRHADLRECRLENTRLQGARLNYADLSNATHLLAGQLAGADVAGAKLPAEVDMFDRLSHIEAVTVSCRNVFFLMLLAATYTWLTIATTSDVDLLTDTATSPLPIILTKLPIGGFYWAAPLVLLGIYIYFHLHLQHLWQDLAALPAFFPDGRALDDKVHPWMLSGLVNAYCPRLRDDRPPMSRVQNFLSIALAWYVVPFTIAALWLRYLPRQNGWGTAFHVAILMITAVAGIAFYRLAIATLSGKPLPDLTAYRFRQLGRNTLLLTEVAILGLTFILLPLLSYGTIGKMPESQPVVVDPRHWAPRLFATLGYNPFADFTDQDVSTRPVNWSEETAPFDAVRGASLKGASLHHAQAAGAFMVKADLRGASLQAADLELANLRRARLQDSNLISASLLQTDLRESDLEAARLPDAAMVLADLRGARLHRADLKGTFLNQADLRQADLSMADLRQAYLNDADLRGANLELAILAGANLHSADLRETIGLQCIQLEAVLLNADTRLPEGLDCNNDKKVE